MPHCSACQQEFTVDQLDLDFFERISPTFAGRTFPLPPPTLCPPCRLMRRLSFRNQIYVHLRKSSFSGNPVFSLYHDNSAVPVISKEEWWGESFDAFSYGRGYDFNRSFFEQFAEFYRTVPRFPTATLECENSDYCNNVTGAKNCYLVFNSSYPEDCIYGENVFKSRDCIDCTQTHNSELCYDCLLCSRCFSLQSSSCCEGCSDSFFLRHCTGCNNCFGCTNLRRKEYCVFNQQLSKKEYQQFIQSINLGSFRARAEYQARTEQFFNEQPRPHMESRFVEDVSGNLIFESKKVFDSFLVRGGENLRYVFNVYPNVRDCWDYSCFGNEAELLYDTVTCGSRAYALKFCNMCWDGSRDLMYCEQCYNCANCFGCIGLHKKAHCILNKQYSKEHYEALTGQIISQMTKQGEWGEFLPTSFSAIPYNESFAVRLFPLEKSEALRRGFSWNDTETLPRQDAVSAALLPDELPDNDTALVALSSRSGKPFRITAEEIKRYRKYRLPLPRLAYDERMEQRTRAIMNITPRSVTCAKSAKPLFTYLPATEPGIIWNREEYEREFA